MSYERELHFLRDVFQKSHIHTQLLPLSELKESVGREPQADRLPNLSESISERTVYRVTDSFEQCYRILLLPDEAVPTVFCVGPFLSEGVTEAQMLEIGERHGISAQRQRYLSEYYASLPILLNDSPLLTMFTTFCETLWKGHAFQVQDITGRPSVADTPISRSMRDLQLDDALVDIKALERRYAFENEMIRAVTLGQAHMESRFRTAFSTHFFEKRHADPLRNIKNYGIIMNTLLRKAAEQGGVHPMHLDQVSSGFAAKIENLPSLSENHALMCEMFRTYCNLVREYSLRQYSPIVQKTILLIGGDLSVDLSPSVLASRQGISLGYLSTVFRKEMGKTVSSYIRERRMEYAAYLLSTTKLQIQTVALHCGIMDAQYFSKLFKAHHKKTPSEYRETRLEC